MSDSRPAPRRGARVAVVLLVVGLVVAGLVLVLAGLGGSPPPSPSPAVAGSAGTSASTGPAGGASRRPDAVAEASRTGAPPARITVPSIDVVSAVNPVGLNRDGTLEVPAPGPLYDQAAWYRGSVTPGERGPSVILGHVDSAKNGPSVFYRLGEMRPGETFTVARADNAVLTFRVDSVRSYPKNDFPTLTVYGATDRPEIRLITCGGDFDSAARSYRDNTVVFAHLVS